MYYGCIRGAALQQAGGKEGPKQRFEAWIYLLQVSEASFALGSRWVPRLASHTYASLISVPHLLTINAMPDLPANGMVLCASDAAHENVEPLNPPADAPVGERVWFGEGNSKQVGMIPSWLAQPV